MEKKITHLTMFVTGSLEEGPKRVFFTYNVETEKARKRNCVYMVEGPDASKTINAIWAAGLAAIKEQEGITS